MSTELTKKQIELYKKAIKGEIKLIGWGVRENYFFQKWQNYLRLSFFVDSNFNLWDRQFDRLKIHNPYVLREYSPEEYALINFYQAEKVKEYTKKTSKLETLPPLPLQHIISIIKGNKQPEKIRPLPQNESATITSLLTSAVACTVGKKKRPTVTTQKMLGRYHWSEYVASVLSNMPTHDYKKNTIALVCNSLHPGGAERQIVNCAIGFKKAGWESFFLASMNDTVTQHYLDTLRSNNITYQYILDGLSKDNPAFAHDILNQLSPEARAVLWHLPSEIVPQTASLIKHFMKIKPSLVIAYLDWSNVAAAIAGVLCGVPEIIVSGRNYSPPRFPHFYEKVADHFHAIYNVLAHCPSVHLTNNAPLAAEDYAKWLGLPKTKVSFVPNCLTEHFMQTARISEVAAVKKMYNIKPNEKVVLGVFRLSVEKRPDKFIKILAQLIKKDNNVRGIVCGIGPLLETCANLANKLKISDRVTFVGLTSEVREIMRAADLMLHTASFEGMPNVMLEAQSQGLPIVCTKSGGVLNSLAPELHPYAFNTNDFKGATKAAQKLLKNAALRQKLGKASIKHVRKEYSIHKLVERNLALTSFASQKKEKKK